MNKETALKWTNIVMINFVNSARNKLVINAMNLFIFIKIK
jgi:hypothetical protein